MKKRYQIDLEGRPHDLLEEENERRGGRSLAAIIGEALEAHLPLDPRVRLSECELKLERLMSEHERLKAEVNRLENITLDEMEEDK